MKSDLSISCCCGVKSLRSVDGKLVGSVLGSWFLLMSCSGPRGRGRSGGLGIVSVMVLLFVSMMVLLAPFVIMLRFLRQVANAPFVSLAALSESSTDGGPPDVCMNSRMCAARFSPVIESSGLTSVYPQL